MGDLPFQLVIRRAAPADVEESLLCTGILRAVPGRRQLYDALWNDRSVVAKVFSHRFKARYHLTRELRGLKQLHKRGLNSPEPLFYGKTQDGRWVVVTGRIMNSATALDVLSETADKDKVLDLLFRVCRELAKQHGKGVLQKDLHLGNFLLAGEQIYALDPRQMQFFRRPVARKKSLSHLALLARYLPGSDTASARVLCEEYFRIRGWRLGKSDEARLQKELTAHRKRGIRGGLKKCLRTSKRHLRIEDRRYVAEFDRGFCDETAMNDFIERVDVLMEAGQILKDGQTSCVSRLTWNGRNVVVKRYNHRGFVHSLRHTLKRSRSCRAWLHGHRLEMLGIATPKPLAYIERHKGLLIWSSYLVTEYIEGQRLHDFLQDDRVAQGRRFQVTREVIGLLEKLWKYRITHGDLKHTNVLITENGPVLTDLDGMVVHRWKLLYRNKQAKDMERFLRAGDGSLMAHASRRAPISEKSTSARRLAACFERMRIDDWAIRIHKDFSKEGLRTLLAVGHSSGDGQGRFLKVPSSDYTCVFKGRISSDGVDRSVYVKRYLRRSRLDFAKHLLRSSRARRAFDASLMLRENGFDAPAVIGLFERRFGPFTIDNMLATREVEHAAPMAQLLGDMCRCGDAKALAHKRALIRAFAETVGQMHARGIFHGDLRLGNVLVAKEHSTWRFYFIDNERTKKFQRLPARLRLKNLVQTNMFQYRVSDTDRLRFVKAYLKYNPAVASDWQNWVRKILAKTSLRLLDKSKKRVDKQAWTSARSRVSRKEE